MRKLLSLAVVMAASTATLTAVPASSAATPAPGSPGTGSIKWADCPEDVAADGVECGTLDVPLDYKKPDGRTIEVMISRLASKNPDKRRGVLLTNPGGPGGAGLSFPAQLKALGLPQDVLDSYDVIGVDPRGVGRSTPVTCDLTDEQQAKGNIPPYAATEADVDEWAAESEKIAEQCANSETADMLPHTTTANTARDLDRIRAALGERTASFLGYSYGTHLGAVYSSLFPETTDRVVLDSSLGPNGWDSEAGRDFGRGMEDRFPDFAEWAAERPEFGLGTTAKQVRAKYFELAERLDEAPEQEIDGVGFRHMTFAQLYADDDASLTLLAKTWQALDKGTELPPFPEPPTMNLENAIAGRLHVVCADSRWPTSVDYYKRNVATDRERYPLYGAAAANIQPCAFWQDPVEKPVEITDEGKRNILIAQNDRDPATPLAGAQKMRRALGDRAALVTADVGGHGTYVLAGNACADDRVTSYLVDGEFPSDDVACEADAPADK
ncbi:alpha/beta hydrolase [Streptomyces sp. XM4193]|uniref:alpha/beta hydrolase n=1 Tax=Streptomyces sp. XM4193 TaxID=2929782 RepID=UPI001FFAA405|nr:alpha/beta hydrolase [Streptomyces sp. XM4193]MCK1798046.1 alpha/beta hydrolase [Streptomyces sp. XM4193]